MEFSDVLRGVSLLFSGVTCGTLICVLLAIVPFMDRLNDGEAVFLKQTIDPMIDRINPPAVVGTWISAGLTLIVADLSGVAVVFTVLGIAASIGVAATSLGVNMRINNTIASWSSEAPPADLRAVLARWTRFHKLRTAFGVIMFVGYIVAAIAGAGG